MRLAAAGALMLAACTPPAPAGSGGPNQVIEGFSMTRSRAGKKAWILESREAILNEREKTATLEDPKLTFFKDGKRTSQLSALHGDVALATKEVRLSSSVAARFEEDQSLLRTEALRYSDAKKKIFSEAPVTVTREGYEVYGQGFEAPPDLSQIRIFKQRTKVKAGKS
jgi:LPS export ABC transporter protein LptC